MLDATDIALLAALQKDARLSTSDLAEQLHLSASQIGRRRQRLEAEGLITAYTARLNARALGLTVQAFIQIQMASHHPDEARAFLRLLQNEPRITSVWTLTGEADYMLRVWCSDLADLNQLVHDRLLPQGVVSRVQSQIVMDQPKADAPLPL